MTSKIAFLFPGQGAQYVGMGKDLYEKYPEAREIYDAADKLLGFSISNICFNGPEETLTETQNAQAGIFVASIAALQVFRKVKPSMKPDFVCGLSLGEFSALVACEAIRFEDGLTLVKRRGELMTLAAKQNLGTMASILGLPIEKCSEICSQTGAQVANINSPEQIVLSGTKDSIEKACQSAQKEGAKVIPLKVSGAFHSRLMEPARTGLIEALKAVTIKTPKCAFIPNVTGQITTDTSFIKELLGRQVVESVQWVKTMTTLKEQNVSDALELGPGKVLKGLAKRNQASFSVLNIDSENELQQTLKLMEEKYAQSGK